MIFNPEFLQHCWNLQFIDNCGISLVYENFKKRLVIQNVKLIEC